MAPSDKDGMALRSKPSVMEKQVTLEEQMICSALQTLNEEACEDVMDEPVEIKRRLSIASNIQDPDFGRLGHRVRSVSQCSSLMDREEREVVMLQSSPLHPYNWQAGVMGSSHEANLDCLSIASLSETPNTILRKNSSAADLVNKPIIQPAILGNHCSLVSHRTSSQGSLVLRPSNSNSPQFTSQRPSSLIVDEYLVTASSVPPLAAVRSQSADERIERKPSITRNNVNASRRSRKKSREEMLGRSVSPSSSLEKLNRHLKEKILRAVPRVGQDVVLSIDLKRDTLDSDDENTPLVSELNSPVHSISGKNDFANGAFGDLGSASCSSEVSPCTPMSPIIIPGVGKEGNRSKSESAISLTEVLDTKNVGMKPAGSGDGKSWKAYAQGDYKDADMSFHRLSPNHLSRQDALDNNKIDEVPVGSKIEEDWANPETSV